MEASEQSEIGALEKYMAATMQCMSSAAMYKNGQLSSDYSS